MKQRKPLHQESALPTARKSTHQEEKEMMNKFFDIKEPPKPKQTCPTKANQVTEESDYKPQSSSHSQLHLKKI